MSNRERYLEDTVGKYDGAFARRYHRGFARLDPTSLLSAARHRAVAWGERRVVAQLLRQVPHGRVLDVPTGTGKLAPVFARLGSEVVAADVSRGMLAVAREEFRDRDVPADCLVADVETVDALFGARFDAAVCLRLLHRVPDDIALSMLQSLAATADHLVVSMAAERQGWGRPAGDAVRRVLGVSRSRHCRHYHECVALLLEAGLKIQAVRRPVPASNEIVFLCRS